MAQTAVWLASWATHDDAECAREFGWERTTGDVASPVALSVSLSGDEAWRDRCKAAAIREWREQNTEGTDDEETAALVEEADATEKAAFWEQRTDHTGPTGCFVEWHWGTEGEGGEPLLVLVFESREAE